MNGSEDAQRELDLDNVIVNVPRRPNLSEACLQQSFTTAPTLATAARKLKQTLLESQCVQTIQYLNLIAASKKVKLNLEIDRQDVAEVMLSILDEVTSWVSVPDAQGKCFTSSFSGQLALQKQRVKQVINHISYLKSKHDTKSPDELQTAPAGSSKVNMWLDDFDDSSTRSFGKRSVWDDEETDLLEK